MTPREFHAGCRAFEERKDAEVRRDRWIVAHLMWASNLPTPWRKSRTPGDFIEGFEAAKREPTVIPPDEMLVNPGDGSRQYAGNAREQRLQWEADLDREAQKKDLN